jgi:hypothetical protein
LLVQELSTVDGAKQFLVRRHNSADRQAHEAELDDVCYAACLTLPMQLRCSVGLSSLHLNLTVYLVTRYMCSTWVVVDRQLKMNLDIHNLKASIQQYLARVYLVTTPRCSLVCQLVLTMLRRRCVPMSYSSTHTRLSYSGAPLLVVSQLPSTPLRVGSTMVSLSSSLRNGEFYADLSGRTQVIKTTASCLAALRHLRGVHRFLPTDIFKSLVVSLVLGQLDHGNAVLCGLPQYQYQ